MAMNAYPPSLKDLIRQFSKLPGLGEKSATRIAMHLLRASQADVDRLATAVHQLQRRIRTCERCYHFTDEPLCAICSDPSRQMGQLCVVESTADLLAIESAGTFRGTYHVLQGSLAPLDGVGPDDLRIQELLERLDKETITEVILATNPSSEGEATAHYLMRLMENHPVRVSRIAYGIPMGGDLKYTDKVTLEKALEGRRTV